MIITRDFIDFELFFLFCFSRVLRQVLYKKCKGIFEVIGDLIDF